MYKICHFADLHIRNTKYHSEYLEIFSNIDKTLEIEKPDIIVHCGDIAHTKTQISPEFVDICSDFLKMLHKHAPTYVILGNHDGNLSNLGRMDSISPIVKSLNLSNLYFSRTSKVWNVSDDLDIHHWSIFDDVRDFQVDKKKINICLYHGPVEGASTDIGFKLHNCDMSVKDFQSFDYVMLGDIHKFHFLNNGNEKPVVAYAGSTIQQSFGEEDDKGFLIWKIFDKNNYKVEKIEYKNPAPFVNLNIEDLSDFKNLNLKIGSKIKIFSDNQVSKQELQHIKQKLQSNFNPEFIQVVNNQQLSDVSTIVEKSKQSLRNIKSQEKIFSDYLKDNGFSDDVIHDILEVNKNFNVLNFEEANRLEYSLKCLKWSNLYNYGDYNRLDFSKLSGIVGIFGKNYSGKSSVFDSLSFTLFNSDSKPSRKNVEIINQNKDNASGIITLESGDKEITIKRKITKYEKNLHNLTTQEAKIELDFLIFDKTLNKSYSLNSETRAQTDQEIQKHIGTLENFLLTSMSAQQDFSNFLNFGSTKRKEIIAKFLDLDIFEEKHNLAKEYKKELESKFKIYENIDYDFQIETLELEKVENLKSIQMLESEKVLQNEKIETLNIQKLELEKLLKKEQKIPNIREILNNLNNSNKTLSEKEKQLQKLILDEENLIKSRSENDESNVDVESLNKEKSELVSNKKEYIRIFKELEKKKYENSVQSKKVEILKEVPCGKEFSHCKFIKDAWCQKENIEKFKDYLDNLELELSKYDKIKIEKRIEEIDDILNNENVRISKIQRLEQEISKIEFLKENLRLLIEKLKDSIHSQEVQKLEYEKNKNFYENVEKHKLEYSQVVNDLKKEKDLMLKCESSLMFYHTKNGAISQKIETLKVDKVQHDELMKKISILELYVKCCHFNGIPFSIIRNNLSIVNNEISKILSNVVDFEIFLEAEDKKLNIFIKHPKYNPRPIEGCSGSEVAFASMAIRLALLNISNIPKSDIFILDEPGTSFDERNLAGFINILNMIKSQFRTVFLVSHMDNLKDVADFVLEIDKDDNGFAKLVV